MHKDVVIIGGGPAGLSLALSLADSGLQVGVVEKSSIDDLRQPPPDGREIALTHQSVGILKSLGVWSRLPQEWISPIMEARVLDGTSSYFMDVRNKTSEGEPLGFLVPNYLIRQALFAAVEEIDSIELVNEVSATGVCAGESNARVTLANDDTLDADLVVAADSRFSETRRNMGISAQTLDFARVAIVCRMTHERPHNGIAFECFQFGGTVAVLPMSGDVASVVLTVSSEKAADINAMSEELFNSDVGERFQHRLGTMQLVGERHSYPLVAVHADRFVSHRFALVGDAAVGMHPVTAHGFNLGLSGQQALAHQIALARSKQLDIGSMAVLRRYEFQHMRATRPLYHGTNALVRLFTNETIPARFLRKAALRLGNDFPPIRGFIANRLTSPEPGRALPR